MRNFEPLLVSTRTACDLLGCGKTFLFQQLRDGRLVRLKLGRKTMIPVDNIRTFAASLARPNYAIEHRDIDVEGYLSPVEPLRTTPGLHGEIA